MTDPLHEDDLADVGILEPSALVQPHSAPDRAVMCFFPEVVDEPGGRRHATLVFSGMRPLFVTEYRGHSVAYFFPGTGAPAAAASMETAIAMGCTTFIAVGGAGALVPTLSVGDVVLIDSAIRDEGTSRHYMPPSRTVDADPATTAAIVSAAQATCTPLHRGRSWTTDAIFRETQGRIRRRVNEGCLVVEMEAAALFAVARYRKARIAQLVYAGDMLGESEWDSRNWTSQVDLRRSLFHLALHAASCAHGLPSRGDARS